MSTTDSASRSRVLAGGGVGLAVGLVVLNAALLRGYVWSYDMVFVPDLPLSDRTLGTDGSVPRAVPTDAVVALLSKVVPGDVVQSIALLATFVIVAAGCAAWCRTVPAAVVAALLATWNPYVIERLVIGHWSFLLGYAALPWVALAARDVAHGTRFRLVGLMGWLAFASVMGSTSALIAAMTAVVVMFVARREGVPWAMPWGTVMVAMAITNAAWLIPALTRDGGVPADPAGVEAFAARADSPWGTLLSLVTLGGIWHQPSWPDSRGSVVTTGVALLMVVAMLVGLSLLRLWRSVRPLACAGAAGLLIAGLASLPGGEQVATWIVTDVPGGGFVRDSHKFVAPLAVFYAIAGGRIVEELMSRRRIRVSRPVSAVLVMALGLAPIATLPDAPAKIHGQMSATAIPDSFLQVRDQLDRAEPGAVAVFPWTLYRRFGWNHERISLDPWNRFVNRRVVVNDDLTLSKQTVLGEDPDAAAISTEVAHGGDQLVEVLNRRGVRWAIVMTDQPGADEATRQLVSGGAHQGDTFGEITIYDLGEAAAGRPAGSPWALILSLVVATGLMLGSVGVSLLARRAKKPEMDPSGC